MEKRGKENNPENLLGLLNDAEKDNESINWGTINQILLKANLFAGMILKNLNDKK